MEYLSAAQAAARAGVRPSTVFRWVASGKLPAQRLASGTLQIAEGDLAAFLPLRDAAPRAMPADATVALAVAQERIRGLAGCGRKGFRGDVRAAGMTALSLSDAFPDGLTACGGARQRGL